MKWDHRKDFAHQKQKVMDVGWCQKLLETSSKGESRATRLSICYSQLFQACADSILYRLGTSCRELIWSKCNVALHHFVRLWPLSYIALVRNECRSTSKAAHSLLCAQVNHQLVDFCQQCLVRLKKILDARLRRWLAQPMIISPMISAVAPFVPLQQSPIK